MHIISSKKTLQKILKENELWVQSKGEKGKEAKLQNTDFSRMKILDIDLSNIDISNSSFNKMIIQNIKINNVKMEQCSFKGTKFNNIYFNNVKASFSNFSTTDMNNIHINESEFDNTIFYNVMIDKLKTNYTDFYSAEFIDSKIKHSHMINTMLENTVMKNLNNDAFPEICPPIGRSFIGYKKVKDKILTLEILKDSKRVSLIYDNCRCNKAKVIKIEEMDGSTSNITEIASDYNMHFIYKLNQVVQSPTFNENRFDEFTDGIHFYMSKNQAKNFRFKN